MAGSVNKGSTGTKQSREKDRNRKKGEGNKLSEKMAQILFLLFSIFLFSSRVVHMPSKREVSWKR